jgi:hypothetical protein
MRAWFQSHWLRGVVVLAFSLAWDASYGAEITHIRLGTSDFGFLTVSGTIKAGDEQRFLAAATNYAKGAVLLKSDGGNLFAGLQIGETIRLRGFSTGVAPGLRCASACALAWLGGTSRYMSSSSLVGFHAAWVLEDGKKQQTGVGNALVGAYLTKLGLPLSAVVYATQSGPDEITWLNPDDAKKAGIEVAILDLEGPATIARPQERKSTDLTEKTETYFYVANTRPPDDFLALRTDPSISIGQRVAKLPNGTALQVFERRADGWWRVRVKVSGLDGWVKSGQGEKKWVLCCVSMEETGSTGGAAERELSSFSCDQLWFGRNSIWKMAGYCFKTSRSITQFGNAGCRYASTDQIMLSQPDRNLMEAIRRAEISKSCAP